MILSFCIPTYNRCEFLKKNIEIIIDQIRELSLEDEIEINISDNCSTDKTEIYCKYIIDKNSNIKINYIRNTTNIGADKNYIAVMHMSHSEYSILMGDDDFLKENALAFIINEIKTSDCGFFISNRTIIDEKGNYKFDQSFLNPIVPTKYYNFSNISELYAYLSMVESLGGVFSFISAIIYKTSILKEIGEYDESFTGTNYAFLYYWWKWLLKGNKLKYLNVSYLNVTYNTLNANNFGVGIDRVITDFKGFLFVANKLINNESVKHNFLNTVFKDHNTLSLCHIYYNYPRKFKNELYPILKQYNWNDKKLNQLINFCSLKRNIINILKLILYRSK